MFSSLSRVIIRNIKRINFSIFDRIFIESLLVDQSTAKPYVVHWTSHIERFQSRLTHWNCWASAKKANLTTKSTTSEIKKFMGLLEWGFNLCRSKLLREFVAIKWFPLENIIFMSDNDGDDLIYSTTIHKISISDKMLENFFVCEENLYGEEKLDENSNVLCTQEILSLG